MIKFIQPSPDIWNYVSDVVTLTVLRGVYETIRIELHTTLRSIQCRALEAEFKNYETH